MFSSIARFRKARRWLRSRFDIDSDFEALEESCIPSYAHGNPLFGWIAWLRLESAVVLWRMYRSGRKVLDFGAGSGVLGTLLADEAEYSFAETDRALAKRIAAAVPDAIDATHDNSARYDAIFALDSLEHNENFENLLEMIAGRLDDGGIFILSGPSENVIYRLGRFLAGFDGHYHHTTIYDIERVARKCMRLEKVRQVPFGLPLFRVSSWRRISHEK